MNLKKAIFFILISICTFIGAIRFLSPSIYDGISFSREVYDKNGTLLRLTLSGDEKYRVFTPLESISPQFVEAVLLLEDRYFYYHIGVNPLSIGRALLSLSADSGRSGASTITMQLARVRYGLRTRTFKGKMLQIIRALQIELTHSKQQILEAYFNLAPYGGPIEGIGAASQIYFARSAKNLSLSESLLLAVIPQSPSQRTLTRGGEVVNEGHLIARQRLLERWILGHPEDQKNLTLLQLPLISQKINNLPFLAPHFTELALKSSSQKKIITTLDLKIQKIVEDKIKNYVDRKSNYGIKNAVAIVVDHENHSVVAAVGSKDFFDKTIEGQVNGVLARRSPGSALKPFVYALAFQQGLIHPQSLLKDTPLEFALYDPENYDQKFLGPLSAQNALVNSRNIPALSLNNDLKNPTFYDFLKSANIILPHDANYYGLSLVLGGTEVSMWEMAELYSMLAHGGELHSLQIEMSEKISSFKKQLLTPESAFVTLDMLTNTPPLHTGYQKKWTTSTSPVAWKTGTSHGFRDAWTAGVAGRYTVIVWLGNFNNTPNPQLIGREMAAPLFFQILDALPESHLKNPSWRQSIGLQLKKIKVCALSGRLPNDYCPHREDTWYQPGKSPIKKCDIHRPIMVSKLTGQRSCGELTANHKIEIYEFWPSDLSNLFEKAGIYKKAPPDFEAQCHRLQNDISPGVKPHITSPAQHISYLKSLSTHVEENTITLQAVADGDVQELYWFVDKSFIGKSKTNHSISYVPEIGEHIISVIDDKGRSDHRPITVEAVQ